MWNNKAKGVYTDIDEPITVEDLQGQDFLVSHTGITFTDNIQIAHDCGIPFFAFVPQMLGKFQINFGSNPAKWPVDDDTLVKHLDKYIRSGTVNRTVHGIIIDCSNVLDEDDGVITAWWITKHGEFIFNAIKERYGIKVYLYMNHTPMALARDNITDTQLLIDFMSKFGICTVDQAKTLNGFPIDTEKVDLPYDDSSIIKWYLWLYDLYEEPWKFLYNGDKAQLYEDLKFEPGSTTEPPPPVTDSTLEQVVTKLDMILLELRKISNHFKE